MLPVGHEEGLVMDVVSFFWIFVGFVMDVASFFGVLWVSC